MNDKINGIIVRGRVLVPEIWYKDPKIYDKCNGCALVGSCYDGTPWPCADEFAGEELAVWKLSKELTDKLNEK